ncbi:MAG: hypothetical protein ABWY52_00530 [Candidatus Limnocylindrales bacterium]
MDEATLAARQQVVEARAALLVEVDELGAAARSAIDVPAKIRRNPLKFAAGAGGLAFLVLRGPQRTARRVTRTLRGGRTATPKSVLPDEIERLVAELGGDAERVRARLDREFADYLASQKQAGHLRSGSANAFWRGANVFTTVFAAQAAGKLAQRLFAADRDRPAGVPSDDELDEM